VLALASAGFVASVPGVSAQGSRFFKESRAELALAKAREDTTVTLVAVTRPGRAAAVAGVVRRLSGVVEQRHDALDYLRLRVRPAQAESVAALPDIEGIAVDVKLEGYGRVYHGLRPDTAGQGSRAPGRSEYPWDHPYVPLADLDAQEWRRQHPTWDGRGVTIADLESAPDFLAPELATGLTIDGRSVPKFLEIRTAGEPGDVSGAAWLEMRDTVVARRGGFQYRGRAYTAPASGRFRVDVLDERSGRPDWLNDFNGDGNPLGSDSVFAVLWDERKNTIWIDTDQDGDFTREHPLKDFSVAHEIGVLGHDNPTTPLRESVGFTVQIDRQRHAVAINLGLGAHASMVQGAAAGARGARGRYDGVAPGARLASIDYGSGSISGYAEALISACADPRIDIIVFEMNHYVTDAVYPVRDGRYVVSVLASRLIERFGKPLLVPAGNEPGLGQVVESGLAAQAISVGAYQSAESYRINSGVVTGKQDNLHVVGSGGPAGDGALKPDLLAPSGVLTSTAGNAVEPAAAGLYYQLPSGYAIGGGTSTATPVAGGAIALLISAAKQVGVPYDAARLRRALLSTTRALGNIQPFEQGNGLLQVAPAWDALVRMARDSTLTPVAISVRAPVRTGVSAWLSTPNVGEGLYETDGWAAGQRGERVLTLTRTSGRPGPWAFATRWVGNDGTFATAGRVTLPLGAPVPLPITVAPTTSGAHSAVLELSDPANANPVRRISFVIIVPDTFAAPNYRLTMRDSVPRPGRLNRFFRVPAGARGLELDFSEMSHDFLSSLSSGILVSLYRPDGRWRHLGEFGQLRKSGGVRYVTWPEPGVWQLTLTGDHTSMHLDQEGESPLGSVPFTLNASILGATVEAKAGSEPDAAAATARSTFSPITGVVTGAPLASGRNDRGWLRTREQRVYQIDMPAGSSLLLARVTPQGDPTADLDLYFFDCTSGKCRSAVTAATMLGSEERAVPQPAPGRWKLVVDAARVTRDSVAYDYLDLVLNPSYGATAVADTSSERRAGAEWTAIGHVWQAATIAPPRKSYAVFTVEDQRIQRLDDRAVLAEDRLPLAWTAVPIPTGR
jgi:hypothetical protein